MLIIGAGGFIGQACAREFLARGARVVAVGRRRRPGGLDGAAVVTAFIDDAEGLARALAGVGPFDAAVNCAGRAADVGAAARFRAANYLGVLNLLACMDRVGIERLVQISTTDVYGLRDFVNADERTPLRGTMGNPYPRYKILAEKAIVRRLPPERYVILRPAAVWGPGDRSILPRVLDHLRRSSVIVHFGRWGGANRWPLAHVTNVARAAWLAATSADARGQAFNVLDPEFTTADDYFRLLIGAGLLPGAPANPRTLRLPFAIGWLAGLASSLLSNWLDRDRPIFEPSLYGLYAASCNLDFSSRKLQALFARHGEQFLDRSAGFTSLAAAHSPSRPNSPSSGDSART